MALDMAAANRFISSLSKSLQALCHGCMDFDSGIEIGGYIYVSVDRGNKLDYVLNEMVEKSDNNSMKFISNSYLSKKDQQKQTRDGACSPVLELQMQSSASNRHSYQYSGNQNHRSSYPHSSQSRFLRGSQKRAWGGTDRGPKKHFRGTNKSSFTAHHQTHNSSFSSSSTQDSKESFRLPEVLGSNDSSDVNNEAVNIKQEMFTLDESTEGNVTGLKSDGGQQNDKNYGRPDNYDTGNIKSDPDSVANEPSINEDSSFKHLQKEDSSFNESFISDVVQSDMPSGSNQSQIDYESADLPVSFNYSEGGDLTTDEFDVIEIGDEDQDVQAMFGDNRK